MEKRRFSDFCASHVMQPHQRDSIGKQAGVPPVVMNRLMVNAPVREKDAMAVLVVLSEFWGYAIDIADIAINIAPPEWGYYQHVYEFKSEREARENEQKLIVISILGSRVQGCVLTFFTRDWLKEEERNALYRVIFPLCFELDLFVEGAYEG